MLGLMHRFLRLAMIAVIGLGAVTSTPILHSAGFFPGIGTAQADDDDGGDDDGDDGDDGGGGRGGRDGGGGDDDDDGPRGDLRQLFRWPSRQAERRPAPRRAAPIPDRSPNEIVALGMSEASLASLTQNGFVVGERIPFALTGNELVKLTIPRGMTLQAARQAVASAAPSASVDFNHFYQPEQGENAACPASDCNLVRHLVGWPVGAAETTCAAPQPIGLIDTAINAKHASLSQARIEILGNSTESQAAPSGEQHGTAVAALLAGTPGSRAPGLLPGVELVAVDVFQRYRKSTDIANVFDLVKAIDLLTTRGIRVINLSLSGPGNLLLEQAVRAAIDKRVILIAAAGNEGPNAKPVFPAAYADVIAVTAVDRRMNPYRRANRGDHIDIAAPGVGVWTAASISGARQKSGTSFAAPFVTAAAAVLLGARPDMTPQQVADALRASADDMGEPGKDRIFGWGLLNARALCQS